MVLDPGGFAISSAGDQYSPRLSFDGSSFLVAWVDAGAGVNGVRWARITPAGDVLDAGDLLGLSPPPCLSSTRSVDIAFDGMNHFLTWIAWQSGVGARVYAARVTPQGATLDPAGIPVSPFLQAQGCWGERFAVSFDGANHATTRSTPCG